VKKEVLKSGVILAACFIIYVAGVAYSHSPDSNLSDNAVNIGTTDPCLDPRQAKLSAAISATASAQLVALQSGQVVYVCGFNYTSTGTNPTTKFVYGTGAVCATGQVALTGTYAPTAGSAVMKPWDGTGFQTAAGNALCLVIAGTTPSIQGVVTYVKK
jgi:hypothetical protein